MAGHDLRQRVEVSDDDRTVATAEVTTSEGSGGTAPGIVARRAGAHHSRALDLPEVQGSARVEAAFRLGDCESLHRLQERCEDVSTRPAGWSALVDANLPSSRAGQHVPDSAGKEPCRAHNDVRGDHPVRQPAAARASTKPASSSSSSAVRAADQRRPARAAAEAGGALAGAHLGGRERGAGGHYQEGASRSERAVVPGPIAQPLPAPLRYQHLLEGIEVLNAFARAEHDRLQRIFGQMERQPCLIAQPLIKAGRTCRPGPNERPGTARQVVTAYPEPAARALAPGAHQEPTITENLNGIDQAIYATGIRPAPATARLSPAAPDALRGRKPASGPRSPQTPPQPQRLSSPSERHPTYAFTQIRCHIAGSRDRTRTYNLPVNSRTLCRLSYAGSTRIRVAHSRRACDAWRVGHLPFTSCSLP